MERKVEISKRFSKKLQNLLVYLELNWSKQVSDDFTIKLELKILKVIKYPEIGMPSKKLGVRSVRVGRHNRIYYVFSSRRIKLLLLRDTRMDPRSNPY